jgi:plastocyanin
MAPGQVQIKLGDVLSAFNHGGETHTFTEVDEFGGGFVQAINNVGGFGPTIPECNPQAVEMLAPGDSFHETTDETGVEKYQCCIHPWMRTEVRIVEH